MLIEFGHIYAQGLIDNKIDMTSLKKSAEIAKRHFNDGDLLAVLLDDKDLNLTRKQRGIVLNRALRIFKEISASPQIIEFEKNFERKAEFFIELIPKGSLRTEQFNKGGKEVDFYVKDDWKIPLRSFSGGQTSYSCQLLSSLWRQFKEKFDVDTLTILERRYEQVERQATQLLLESGHSSTVGHSFIWY